MTGDTKTLDEYVADWSPPRQSKTEVIDLKPAAALSAVLECANGFAPGSTVPLAWHWLYFLDWPRRNSLALDGHPEGGGFMPPIPDRTRMFAGGSLTIHGPLVFGESANRTSSMLDVQHRNGRSGEMLFVPVRHEIRQGGQLVLTDQQDLVYRRKIEGGTPAPRPVEEQSSVDPDCVVPFAADPMLLFRFSALTANTHRIHYDEPYTTRIEGFPGLVVHGPLLVILMSQVLSEQFPQADVSSFKYRLRRPVFVNDAFMVTGEGADGLVHLKVIQESGAICAEATAVLA